jgi:hypothetical protein
MNGQYMLSSPRASQRFEDLVQADSKGDAGAVIAVERRSTQADGPSMNEWMIRADGIGLATEDFGDRTHRLGFSSRVQWRPCSGARILWFFQ